MQKLSDPHKQGQNAKVFARPELNGKRLGPDGTAKRRQAAIRQLEQSASTLRKELFAEGRAHGRRLAGRQELVKQLRLSIRERVDIEWAQTFALEDLRAAKARMPSLRERMQMMPEAEARKAAEKLFGEALDHDQGWMAAADIYLSGLSSLTVIREALDGAGLFIDWMWVEDDGGAALAWFQPVEGGGATLRDFLLRFNEADDERVMTPARLAECARRYDPDAIRATFERMNDENRMALGELRLHNDWLHNRFVRLKKALAPADLRLVGGLVAEHMKAREQLLGAMEGLDEDYQSYVLEAGTPLDVPGFNRRLREFAAGHHYHLVITCKEPDPVRALRALSRPGAKVLFSDDTRPGVEYLLENVGRRVRLYRLAPNCPKPRPGWIDRLENEFAMMRRLDAGEALIGGQNERIRALRERLEQCESELAEMRTPGKTPGF